MRRHRILKYLVPVTKEMDWAYPIEGLKWRGRQLYRVVGEDGAYVESLLGGEFPAYLTDRDEVGELSWAKAHLLDEAMREVLENQVREE